MSGIMTKEEIGGEWVENGKTIIEDLKKHVRNICLARVPSSNANVYFNLTTLETKDFCIELSGQGFQIVGEKYDSQDARGHYPVYETPYSLLDNISPGYRISFGEHLVTKLNQLIQGRTIKKDGDRNE